MTSAILAYLTTRPQGAFAQEIAKQLFSRYAPEWKEITPWGRGKARMAIVSTTGKLSWMKKKGLVTTRRVCIAGVGVRSIWSINERR